MVRAYRRKNRAKIDIDIFKIIDMPTDALAHKLDIQYDSAEEIQDMLDRFNGLEQALSDAENKARRLESRGDD